MDFIYTKHIYRYYWIFLLLIITTNSNVYSQDTISSLYSFSFKELSEINVTTGSIKKESILASPTNVTIVTKQMIDERDYQTLVDVCQDIPYFDFRTYNDAGGEDPGYSKNRGVGQAGNSEVLIMINGIVQNNISFNWSLLWTNENLFIDIKQIEIIQGPGSVMYGAQAFTGIINIITEKEYIGVKATSSLSSNNSFGNDIYLGTKIKQNIHLALAYYQYVSEGDNGIGRYDPGEYFSNLLQPDSILADYDKNGNYVLNIPNPLAGKPIPPGFNTSKNSHVLRGTASYKNTELGFFISDYIRGNASYILPYEYNTTGKEFSSHYKSYHTYLKNNSKINSKLSLQSELVFRASHLLPLTGMRYIFKFPNLTKNYKSYAYQSYLEEKLTYTFSSNNFFYFGIKASYSQKTDQIISLGGYDDSQNSTNYSWDIASEGNGLYQVQEYPNFYEKEVAVYALWDSKFGKLFSSSMGVRYDYSNIAGNIFNPRFAIMYSPKSTLGIKLIFGTAFRQAGIQERYNEFRGNPNLKPEKIRTTELIANNLLLKRRLRLKFNIFHSIITDYIGSKPDSTTLSGSRFTNIARKDINGMALEISGQLTKKIRLYSNYSYLFGLNADSLTFYEIDNVAKLKFNAGINYKLFKNKLTTDFRINYVGKRKALDTNKWMQIYEDGYGASYLKANFAVTYKLMKNLIIQLTINNVFNEKYYGMGIVSGSGFVEDYDPAYNINPNGHIMPYHPQPGRTFSLNLKLDL